MAGTYSKYRVVQVCAAEMPLFWAILHSISPCKKTVLLS